MLDWLKLNVQLQLYQAWVCPKDGKPQKMNCRVKVLQFVVEAEKSLRRVLNHPVMRHTISDIEHLDLHTQYADCLSTIASQQRFALYHQAPTTAGKQMMTLTYWNNHYGSTLCNNQAAVSTVLHLYNALMQKGLLEEIPLFEKLCMLLNDIVFSGHRNAPHYGTALKRSLGGKLARSKKVRGQVSALLLLSRTRS
jgi:hypothetical protein